MRSPSAIAKWAWASQWSAASLPRSRLIAIVAVSATAIGRCVSACGATGTSAKRRDVRVENRAAGRQRVRGRSGRRRDDDAVGAHHVDEPAIDLDRAFDHRAAAAAIENDVVQRQRGFARAVRANDLRGEQRAALLDVTPSEHGGDRRLHPRDRDVGQEAQSSLVDPDERHVERREAPRDPEHRAVAADDDRDVGVRGQRFGRPRHG